MFRGAHCFRFLLSSAQHTRHCAQRVALSYLRNKALNGDMSKYECCQRKVCASCSEKCCSCCEGTCPCITLCFEALFCNCLAISGTRAYVQEERQIVSDPCDNRIIRLSNICQILACFCTILAIFCSECNNAAECMRLMANIIYVITSSCMQAQTYVELDTFPTPADYKA